MTDPVLRMTTGAENSPTWTNYTPGVSERTSGTSKFMHAGIKNTDAQTDSSQAISATREYDAFGNVTASTGSHTGRFGYGGPYGYQEDEGGLKQLGHRLYDPVCGRFVTKDPIKDGRNWYVYCSNNPLNRFDPSGFGWHDPGIVYVDPGFKGRVIVVGEDQGSGDDQVSYELLPGQHSNPHVDVDIIIVIMPDGTIEVYAFVGTKIPIGWDQPQLAIVHSDGSVTGPNIHSGDRNAYMFAFGINANKNLKGAGGKYPPRQGMPDMAKYLVGLNPGMRWNPKPPATMLTPPTSPPGGRPWNGMLRP